MRRRHHPRGGREFHRPWRLEPRHAVHPRDGLAVSDRPRPRQARRRRHHDGHGPRGGPLSRVRPHEGLGGSLAGSGHARQIPGAGQRHAARRNLRHEGRRVGLARRGHGRAAEGGLPAGPPRPHRLRRPLRLRPADHRRDATARRCGNPRRLAAGGPRPARGARREGAVRSGRDRRRLRGDGGPRSQPPAWA